MKYYRKVILSLFQRNYCNNESEYDEVLDVVYPNHIPEKIKKCPTFTEKENFEEALYFHVLNNEGLNVNIFHD
jgi:hypothetical protein